MIRPNMFTFSSVALFLTASLLLAISPTAATMTDAGGFPEGKIASGNIAVPATGSADVFTVPDDKIFVLTTFCGTTVIRLSGSTLGPLGLLVGADRGCFIIDPVGFVIPKGEVLSCVTSGVGSGHSCMVSGILPDQKKRFPFKFK